VVAARRHHGVGGKDAEDVRHVVDVAHDGQAGERAAGRTVGQCDADHVVAVTRLAGEVPRRLGDRGGGADEHDAVGVLPVQASAGDEPPAGEPAGGDEHAEAEREDGEHPAAGQLEPGEEGGDQGGREGEEGGAEDAAVLHGAGADLPLVAAVDEGEGGDPGEGHEQGRLHRAEVEVAGATGHDDRVVGQPQQVAHQHSGGDHDEVDGQKAVGVAQGPATDARCVGGKRESEREGGGGHVANPFGEIRNAATVVG
jgi:hypothetical protein